MNAQKLSSTCLAALVLTSLALQGCGGTPQSGLTNTAQEAGDSASDEIFTEAPATETAQIASDEKGEKISRKRFVTVNFKALKRAIQRAQDDAASGGTISEKLRLNLFKDKNLTIIIEGIEQVSDDNIVITGHVEGDENSGVSLVLNEGVLIANITTSEGQDNFEVRYTERGIHAVQIPVLSGDADCESVEVPSEDRIADESMLSPAAEPIIDMLVAYTPAARSRVGGTAAMKALIQTGIADTNRAFADSGATVTVRLAGTMEVKRNESGSWSSDLSALRGTSDGRWDEVHAERKRLGADQVSLVGSYSNSSVAGIGYRMASSSTAFTISKVSSFSQYTFTHELGHNLGLKHEDGYVNSSGRFRTIMAYGSLKRIRRFSNPNMPYNGYKTGTSSNNSVSIINRNDTTIAGFRTPLFLTSAADEPAAIETDVNLDKDSKR